MNKPIKSTDKDALEKLRAKLAELEETQETMKKQNKYFRTNGSMKGYPDISDEQAAKIDVRIANDYSWNKTPAPKWILQGNNQEIHRIKDRIKAIEAEHARRESEDKPNYNTDKLGFEVVENEEIERLQIIYSGGGRVDNDTYRSLRSHGFVFSRTNNAFQRQLNQSARRSAKWFIQEQQALLKKTEAEM